MWELLEAKRNSNNSNRRTLSKKAPRGLRSLQKKRSSDGKGKDGGKGKLAPEPVDPAVCEIAVSKASQSPITPTAINLVDKLLT
jgi:hypothetical protein